MNYWMDIPTWWFHTCIYRSCCCCNHLFSTRILVAHFTNKLDGCFYTTVVSLSKSLYNHILKEKINIKNKLLKNGKTTKNHEDLTIYPPVILTRYIFELREINNELKMLSSQQILKKKKKINSLDLQEEKVSFVVDLGSVFLEIQTEVLDSQPMP